MDLGDKTLSRPKFSPFILYTCYIKNLNPLELPYFHFHSLDFHAKSLKAPSKCKEYSQPSTPSDVEPTVLNALLWKDLSICGFCTQGLLEPIPCGYQGTNGLTEIA